MLRSWPTGLIEVADRVFAYVREGGGLCIANAGLVVGPESCVAIDALFAPSMTRAFLAAISRVSDKPVRVLINTHHHVDHTMGNALFPEATVLSHANADREQRRVGRGVLDILRRLIPDLVAELDDVPLRFPDVTFDDELTFRLGERTIRLLHLGPAHTIGDALVLLPEERLVFTGDVVFDQVTPLGLEGHFGNWIDVCDAVKAIDADTLVPGHGPVGDKTGLRDMQRYLQSTREQARRAFDAGTTAQDAAREIDLGEYASWAEADRIGMNVGRMYQEFASEKDL